MCLCVCASGINGYYHYDNVNYSQTIRPEECRHIYLTATQLCVCVCVCVHVHVQVCVCTTFLYMCISMCAQLCVHMGAIANQIYLLDRVITLGQALAKC